MLARLELDPTSRVFDVAGGFLLELDRPSTGVFPGAIRLRALAPGLYVPVSAFLVPSLLDDEARGLVRDWGLVLLPEGRALVFDRHGPVPLDQLLRVPARSRRPAPPPGAAPSGRPAGASRPRAARAPARGALSRIQAENQRPRARSRHVQYRRRCRRRLARDERRSGPGRWSWRRPGPGSGRALHPRGHGSVVPNDDDARWRRRQRTEAESPVGMGRSFRLAHEAGA